MVALPPDTSVPLLDIHFRLKFGCEDGAPGAAEVFTADTPLMSGQDHWVKACFVPLRVAQELVVCRLGQHQHTNELGKLLVELVLSQDDHGPVMSLLFDERGVVADVTDPNLPVRHQVKCGLLGVGIVGFERERVQGFMHGSLWRPTRASNQKVMLQMQFQQMQNNRSPATPSPH